jgi:RNA polymerase sigma-70 factor (ECF subfamily)
MPVAGEDAPWTQPAVDDAARQATPAAIGEIVREEAGRLTATLMRLLGDFDLAEELVQDALVAALEHWPRSGLPARPGAWLLTTARRKAIDRWRREEDYRTKLRLLEAMPHTVPGEADDRLRLIFICCHPALAREAQVALTLRAVLGLTTAEIARAFLTTEATVAQRIVRAKRKIVAARIPYRVPHEQELGERLNDVLTVLYLLFNEGYLSIGDQVAARHELTRDAEWLAGLVVRLMPDQPEALGLLALMRLHLARTAARFDGAGQMVLLRDQDRGLWDRDAIANAAALVVTALRMRRPGPYQIQAAIAACHAEALSWEETDWRQIWSLYGVLHGLAPSPIVALNRAIALRHLRGPRAALADVDALAPRLDHYHLYHATRAELLRAVGREEQAREADRRALELTGNPAERDLLTQRLSDPGLPEDVRTTRLSSLE